MVADEERSLATATEHGGTVLEPDSPEEWEKGARGVWQDFADIVGGFHRIESVRNIG